MWRNWNCCALPVRKENAAAKETIWQFLRSRITLWSSISISGYIAKRVKNKTQGDNYPSMFIAALFTRAKGESNPSVYWQMNEKLKYCVYIRWICNACSVAQSCLTLCGPMDCNPPSCSVHGIFHASVLGWVVISYARRSSQPRDWAHISCSSCIAGRFLTTAPPGKSKMNVIWH